MMPIAALIVALLGSHQVPKPLEPKVPVTNQSVDSYFGLPVEPVVPADGAIGFPPEVEAWTGWNGLGSYKSMAQEVFPVDFGWPAIAAKVRQVASPQAAVWRVKVFAFRKLDILRRDATNIVRQERMTMERPDFQRLANALGLAKRIIEAQTNGQVRVQFDAVEEPEPVSVDVNLGPATPNPLVAAISSLNGESNSPMSPISAYLAARVNGGAFDADDHQYRGPYNDILVVYPATENSSFNLSSVNGMPARALAIAGRDGRSSLGGLVVQVLEAEQSAANVAAARSGARTAESATASLPIVFANRISLPLASWASLKPVTASKFLANESLPLSGQPDFSVGNSISGLSPISDNASLSFINDPQRGQCLELKITGLLRRGGFALPATATDSNGTKKVLSFWMMSRSKDAIGIFRSSVEKGLAKGFDLRFGQGSVSGTVIPVVNDGAWHQVAIQLSEIAPFGTKDAGSLVLGFSPDEVSAERNQVAPIVYDFSDFAITESVPDGALTSEAGASSPEELKVIELQKAIAEPSVAGYIDKVKAAIADKSDLVRLNALRLVDYHQHPDLEAAVTEAIPNIEPRISEAAVQALGDIGTETAIATLKLQLLRQGTPRTKSMAAIVLSKLHDPKMAGPISTLLENHSWRARLAGVKAIAENGGPQREPLLAVFLQQDNPEIRLLAVAEMNAKDPVSARALLYPSVNDPSDAVRGAACVQLLQSTTNRADGYRGVTDDSAWVRQIVLSWIADHPSPDDRPSLRQAVAFTDAATRGAALHALAHSKEPVTLEELGDVAKDSRPEVVTALAELEKAKSITLPRS